MKIEESKQFVRRCILGAAGGIFMAAGDWLLGMLAFHPVIWNILLVGLPDIAQAMQVPAATWMSVMSQSSTNSSIVIWCVAAAVYEKKHSAGKDDKWTQIIDDMTIYRDAQLKQLLEQAGFRNVQIHKKKSWLCATAQK